MAIKADAQSRCSSFGVLVQDFQVDAQAFVVVPTLTHRYNAVRGQAFSYGTFLRTENERFQFSKPIVSLMGSKMVHFRVKFFDFHFRDGLHSEMEPHFRSTS